MPDDMADLEPDTLHEVYNEYGEAVYESFDADDAKAVRDDLNLHGIGVYVLKSTPV